MNAEIIAVGTEILLGDINNSHAQFLSKQLALLGINVHYQTAVGDNVERLKEVLKLALTRSDIIITTGGLGPTTDDLTKETVCEVIGIDCEIDQDILNDIKAFFEKTGREMSDNNIKQAAVPSGSTVFKNDKGTAPGMAIESDRQAIIMLPGPPRELLPMFETSVVPYLSKFSDGSLVSKNLMVFGIGEGQVEEMLGDIVKGTNPTVALYAKDGEVLIRVTAKGKDKLDANNLVLPVVFEIKQILGDSVYGVNVDSLQQTVVDKLLAEGKMIATAESCTGGLLSQKITDISGSSKVFEFGISSYANRVKQEMLGIPESLIEKHGAVSEKVAALMAQGAMKKGKADIGVGITGIAGPTGGSDEKPVGTVFIAVTIDDKVWVQKFLLGHGSENERDYIRELSTLHALNMVRLLLDESETATNALVPINDILSSKESNLKTDNRPWYKKLLMYFVPWKGDSIGEIVRKVVFVAAAVGFIVSGVILGNYFVGNVQSDNILEDVQTMHTTPPTPEEIAKLPDGYLQKFASLYSKNSDIKGWITIPNSKVDYPVMQSKDNDYYLKHAFNKAYNQNGTPFVDYRSEITKDKLSTNTIIYSHNIRGGRYFAQIANYQKLDFYKINPVITFDTVYEEAKWKVVSAFITNANRKQDNGQLFDYYNFIDARSDAHFNWFKEEITRRSIISTGVDLLPTDKLITLSTCTYEIDDARFVVVARKVRPGESATVDTNAAILNPKTLYPQAWYDKNGGSKPDYPPNPKPTGDAQESVSSQAAVSSSSSSAPISSSVPPSSSGLQSSSSSTTSSNVATSSQEAASSKASNSSKASSSKASSSKTSSVYVPPKPPNPSSGTHTSSAEVSSDDTIVTDEPF
jgi:SrtB family sortase